MNTPVDKAGMSRRVWRLPARTEGLAGLLTDVEGVLAAAGWAMTASHPVLMAIEELATNAIKYGYPAAPGTLEVTLAVVAGKADLTLRDDGMPFDPLAAPEPDLAQPVEDRPIGGLGLHLVRRQAAHFAYRRLATGHNEMHLVFRQK